MYGYNKKDLYNFIQEKLEGYTVGNIQSRDVPGWLGQGISRTVLQFKEYPDIVFKIGVGEEDFGTDAFETEETIYYKAMEDGFAHYLMPIEYIGAIELDYWYDRWSEEADEYGEYYSIEEREQVMIDIYIQPRIDYTFSQKTGVFEIGSLKREKSIAKHICETEDIFALGYRELSAYFIRKYGVEEYIKVSHYLCDTLKLDDLHNNNWAIKDGDLVLIDYAM